MSDGVHKIYTSCTSSVMNENYYFVSFLDQWSPLNTDGKKCYDRDFLICLQNNPKCKKKPDNLPDLDIVLKDNNRVSFVFFSSYYVMYHNKMIFNSHELIHVHSLTDNPRC